MDDNTIIKLLSDQHKHQDEKIDKMETNIKEYFQVSMTLNRAKIINELDPIRIGQDQIVAQNAVRNHRTEKLEDQTRFFRMMHRHPIKSAIVAIVFIMMCAYGYHKMNLNSTIKNITGIELHKELDNN